METMANLQTNHTLLLPQQPTTELMISGKTTGFHRTNSYEILEDL
jgi:hypothetical protein